ncbi:hypothetical protein [Paenibacillus sp. BC26]|uniref:hypothetical protein n=1 Tax=Paenibacillus sp. BC26 TaxID=1881032 RepID=UPI0008F2E2BD|nr:hypothetical protein [Paenibacillus sp. BC26]SFS47407.1 hypothetical protein SAMN05428962_0266 [Paenibacillus sp. BC26]
MRMIKRTKFSTRIARWRVLAVRENGSFTLESSLVFPMIFAALITLLMLGMYTYQKVVLYTVASQTAERTAFRWDNSARNAVSGIGVTGKYDGLYWRLSDNGALQTLFGSEGGDQGGLSIPIGNASASPTSDERSSGSESLPLKKMAPGAVKVREPIEGVMIYDGVWVKRIDVKLRQPLSIPPLEAIFGHSEPMAVTDAVIVDPVELIRNVDLVRYYAGRAAGQSEQGKEQAREVLHNRQSLQDQAQ